MSSYVSQELRRMVEARAFDRCEYCLTHVDDALVGCEVDHIISEKHGGLTIAENLAFSCAYCNRRKGTDVGSVTAIGQFVRFFNPRTDTWHEHFAVRRARIESVTEIGWVTVKVLGLNEPDRVEERAILQAAKRFPSKG